MRTAFFVQNNYVERLTVPVATFARQNGFALEDRSSLIGFNPDDCGIDWTQYVVVIPYGSVQFLRQCKASSLSRFVLHDESMFATSKWIPFFGAKALNHAGRAAPVGQVAGLLEQGGSYHLRPDRVDKAFTGAVVGLQEWLSVVSERTLDTHLGCWVTPVQAIAAEWRCWVVGGRVISISKYREESKMAVSPESSVEVWAAARELAGVFLPEPCVVLDIAKTDRGFSVVEFNPIHCSGWYAADTPKVLTKWAEWSQGHFDTHSERLPNERQVIV